MNKHELATLAIDDAIKSAKELLAELEKAKRALRENNHPIAGLRLSDAVSTASYLDHHYIPNAQGAVRDLEQR